MVLGNLKRVLIALLIGMPTSVQAADFVTDLTIGETTYTLVADGARCGMSTDGTSILLFLDIAAPCGFVSHDGQTAQTQDYLPVTTIAVAAGPPAQESEHVAGGSDLEHRCSHVGQPMVIDGLNVSLRPAQLEPFRYCHNLGFDEKVFYGIAHPVD